jgi:hypothetical protein
MHILLIELFHISNNLLLLRSQSSPKILKLPRDEHFISIIFVIGLLYLLEKGIFVLGHGLVRAGYQVNNLHVVPFDLVQSFLHQLHIMILMPA